MVTAQPVGESEPVVPVEWTLKLPWTKPSLMDNDRSHWAAKARKVAEARQLAAWLARSERLPRGLSVVDVCLHWQPSTNRRRDALGPAPSLKPLVDGLVDYGLVPDDDTKHVRHLSCCIHEWQRDLPARCWLTVRVVDGAE